MRRPLLSFIPRPLNVLRILPMPDEVTIEADVRRTTASCPDVPAGLLAFSIALLAPTTTMRALLSGSMSLAGLAAALLGFLQIGCGMAGSGLSAMLFDDPVTAFDTVPPFLLFIALSAAAARRRGRPALIRI